MSDTSRSAATQSRSNTAAKAAAATAALGIARGAHAAGSDLVRIALIGCGGRGTGAAIDCLKGAPGVEVVALGDLVADRVETSLARLTKEFPDRVKVPPERQFTGFDNYQKVCACQDVNLIITAAPPGFRPIHVKAAIDAGKHVFMEKPVAVDPLGVRSIIATSEVAKQKKLAIVAGTQRRHQKRYLELMKRIHDGQIGEIVAAQCYWNQGDLWVKERTATMSEMEWQCRNWLYFSWLSGDHIVEQHVHNIDVVNWVMGAMPKNVMGMGGRQVRVGPQFGNIFDHFAVRYEYESGLTMYAMATQQRGISTRVGNVIHGTKGTARVDRATASIKGEKPWTFDGEGSSGDLAMHAALVRAIRERKPINEGVRLAEATMTGVMGRMSAYTGRALKWDWVMQASKLDLRPSRYEMGPLPVEPVAMPGRTPLV